MVLNSTTLSAGEIQKYFGKPTALPSDGTFELALVLGGTVSAGAYTAGVLDFLFEALDAWTALRDDPQKNPGVPRHKVLLKFISGASGGGVNAAIAARALAYDFPHVIKATTPATAATNPFYDIWMNRLTFEGFLGTNDLSRGKVASILDGDVIDRAAAAIETYEGKSPAPQRPYLANPLRFFLTLTNLRGVPYKTNFGFPSGKMSETFVDHADYARFAVVYPGNTLAEARPDEFVLGFGNAKLPQQEKWSTFGSYAMGTAAFPIGFPPRDLVRPLQHYRYRVISLPDEGGKIRIVPLVPDWDAITASNTPQDSDIYRFVVVDGGATDNEPIQLARTALAGLDGWNPRNGEEAKRAVLLVDPFAGSAGPGQPTAQGLFKDAGSLVQTMLQQTRYDSRDILLAEDDSVYSRFMIAAKRGGAVGDAAIASSGLMAFLGFTSQDFARHDYFLGRANCQAYLINEFVLPEKAKAFDDGWAGVPTDKFAVSKIDPVTGKSITCLPIIPLFGTAAITENPEPWPKGALDPEIYRDSIETRFKGLIDSGVTGGFFTGIATWLVDHLGEKSVADFVIGQINTALIKADLK